MSVPALLAAALFGLVAGFGIRFGLRRLERGTEIRPGPLEVASTVVCLVGILLSGGRDTWPLVLWMGLLGVALTAVDLRHHRLPDAITLPAIPVTVAICVVVDVGSPDSGDLMNATLGSVVLGALFYGLARAWPAAMGLGDAKLTYSLGFAAAYLSWTAWLVAVVLAFVLGSLVALIGLATRRLTLKSALPFGPPLLAGCWLVLAVPQLTTVFQRL